MKAMSRKGFTLIEILIVVIILGILAAIVIPQFASASDDAKKSAVRSTVQSVRGQIELYKLQHNDRYPNGAVGDPSTTDETDLIVWEKLTTATTVDGVQATAAEIAASKAGTGAKVFGPYMQETPMNPFSGTSVIDDAPGTGVDWVFDAQGRFWGDRKSVV